MGPGLRGGGGLSLSQGEKLACCSIGGGGGAGPDPMRGRTGLKAGKKPGHHSGPRVTWQWGRGDRRSGLRADAGEGEGARGVGLGLRGEEGPTQLLPHQAGPTPPPLPTPPLPQGGAVPTWGGGWPDSSCYGRGGAGLLPCSSCPPLPLLLSARACCHGPASPQSWAQTSPTSAPGSLLNFPHRSGRD